MATSRWIGRAESVAQKDTITVAGTWATADTATLTIGGANLTYTVGSLTTTAQVATGIKEMVEGGTFTDTTATSNALGTNVPQFSGITATVSGSVVTMTADTRGKPFTLTATEVTAGTGTATRGASQAATSKNHVDDPDNWTEGSVPGAGDDVYIDNSSVSLLYGLDQLSGTLTSLHIGASFTGTIGLPKNASGYAEYLPDYLVVDCTTITIGEGVGNGSGRIKINSGSVQTAVTVIKGGSSAEQGLPAILWKGTHASNALTLQDCSFGAAAIADETATVATLRASGSANVTMGAGVGTITTTTVSGQARVTIEDSALTTLTVHGGYVTTRGSGTGGTVTINSGKVDWNSTGTITTLAMGGRPGTATLDATGELTPKTITSCTMQENAVLTDTNKVLTITNNVAIGSGATTIRT